MFEGWVSAHGLPGSLYVDRDSIYRCERVASVAEQIAGKEPRTQFGRAMETLGVEVIMAHSPQAKGRVERRNGLLQDRLVKEMRLAGINDLESGNEFLRKKFLPALNAKFTVAARSPADAHRPAPADLTQTLSWQEERVVHSDWTVSWEGSWFQILREHEGLNLAGRKILVRHLRSGGERVFGLHWHAIPGRSSASATGASSSLTSGEIGRGSVGVRTHPATR